MFRSKPVIQQKRLNLFSILSWQ